MIERTELLKRIQSNIAKDGYHVTLVTGITLPRFAYTIGCKEVFGSELIFAGGEFYSKNNVSEIIDRVVKELKKGVDWRSVSITIDALGSFSLLKVDKSWSELLMLGAFDFYNQTGIEALQILPDKAHHTLDVPDTSKQFEADSQPVWQWLVREWNYSVPRDSTAVTNLKVLYGEKATEVMRWETNEWEIFSGVGPDVKKEDMRTVPMAMLIGIDDSLKPAFSLNVGKGLWRDPVELVWNSWG